MMMTSTARRSRPQIRRDQYPGNGVQRRQIGQIAFGRISRERADNNADNPTTIIASPRPKIFFGKDFFESAAVLTAKLYRAARRIDCICCNRADRVFQVSRRLMCARAGCSTAFAQHKPALSKAVRLTRVNRTALTRVNIRVERASQSLVRVLAERLMPRGRVVSLLLRSASRWRDRLAQAASHA